MQKLLLTTSQERTNAQPISKEWLPWKDSIVADHDVKWHGHQLPLVSWGQLSPPGCFHPQPSHWGTGWETEKLLKLWKHCTIIVKILEWHKCETQNCMGLLLRNLPPSQPDQVLLALQESEWFLNILMGLKNTILIPFVCLSFLSCMAWLFMYIIVVQASQGVHKKTP